MRVFGGFLRNNLALMKNCPRMWGGGGRGVQGTLNYLLVQGIHNCFNHAPIDVPRPLTNDLWVFLFQTIDAQCVK